MAFIQTISEPEAAGATADLYQQSLARSGYVPNMTKAFSHRPEVNAGWTALLGSVRGNMELRRYELVTLAAARELRSSYCMLAHGSVVLREFFTEAELLDIVAERANSALTDLERAIMRFATRVVRDATSISQGDVDALKSHGLSDAEIFDVVTCAAARCFFSKTLDALGVEPDAAYATIDPELRTALVVGRPIEKTAS